MKKTKLSIVLGLLSCFAAEANTLLQSPVTGTPFSTGKVNDIELISNGTDAALVIANNTTGKIYIIDIADNNPADSASNVVNAIIPNFTASISTALGITGLTVMNFEVNPISKSLWVLVSDASSNTYVVKVTNNGSTVTAFNLSSVTYSSVTFSSTAMTIQDLTWGDNTLYISSANSSLNGEVGKMTSPFMHNSSTTNRTTSMFKSNWGSTYYTNAPLEKMDYGSVVGINKLMGVTTCAPGFSFEESLVSGTGVLQVTEDFDMNGLDPLKVISVTQNGSAYLIALHMTFSTKALYRIGERFLDGSQVAASQYNSTSVKVRDFSGNPSSGLTAEEMTKYTGSFKMAAFFTDYELLVLDAADNLYLFVIGTSTVALAENSSNASIKFFPNPAHNSIVISNNVEFPESAILKVITIEGKEALSINLGQNLEQRIDISSLSRGQYMISIIAGNNKILSDKLIIQ